MEKTIEVILNFFVDSSKRLTAKAGAFLGIIFILLLVDNTSGFTYFYGNDKKITQVKQISEVLHDTTLSKLERQDINNLRRDIINRKTWKDGVWVYLSNVSINWQFITASCFWLIGILILPIIAFTDKTSQISKNILGVFFVDFVFFLFATFQAKLLAHVPIFGGYPLINYIFNIFVNIGLILLFSSLIDRNKKKTNVLNATEALKAAMTDKLKS